MRKLLIFLIIGCFALGYAGAEQNKPNDTYTLADAAVKRLFNVYRHYSRDMFNRIVHPELMSSTDFINQVENGLNSGIVTDMTYTIDSTVQKGDLLSIKITWEKKAESYKTRQEVVTQGKAELIFKATTDWLLYQIKGNSPF